MRIIVDEMPKDCVDCPFGRVFTYLYSDKVKETKCQLADGGPCDLKDGKCSWLKWIDEDKVTTESLMDAFKALGSDTNYLDTMNELITWFTDYGEKDE